jgi:hypothetical protein
MVLRSLSRGEETERRGAKQCSRKRQDYSGVLHDRGPYLIVIVE